MRRVAVAIASLFIGVFGVTSASAHAELVSMTPAVGSVVTAPPASVTLTFGEDIAAMGSTIVVLAPSGAPVQSGDPTVNGMTIDVGLQSLTETGTYQVNFRVLSADGHIVNDSASFTYAPADPSATPALASTQSATPAASTLTASPETSAVTQHSSSIGYWIVGFVVLALIIAAVGVRRAKR